MANNQNYVNLGWTCASPSSHVPTPTPFAQSQSPHPKTHKLSLFRTNQAAFNQRQQQFVSFINAWFTRGDGPMESSPVSRLDSLSSSSKSPFVGLVSYPSLLFGLSFPSSLSSFSYSSSSSSFFSVFSSFSSSSSFGHSSSVEHHDQPSVDPQLSSRLGFPPEKSPDCISSSATPAVPRSVPPSSQGILLIPSPSLSLSPLLFTLVASCDVL